MKIFSALLALCAGNSPAPGEFPTQRPVTRSFDVFFDLRLDKRLSKQSWGWWFETLSRPLWPHSNDTSAENKDSNLNDWKNIDGLVQDCSISIANALEILQSCTKPSIWTFDSNSQCESKHVLLFDLSWAREGSMPSLTWVLRDPRGVLWSNDDSDLFVCNQASINVSRCNQASINVSQRLQVHQHLAQALTGKDCLYPCLIRWRRYCCYPQVEIRRDVLGHVVAGPGTGNHHLGPGTELLSLHVVVSGLNELPELAFVCFSLFISFNALLNVHCMSIMALSWSPQRCTSSDSGCDRLRRSALTSGLSPTEIWVSGCDRVSSGWHGAVIVSMGKHVTRPDIYWNKRTRSLAHAARAVTPLRDLRRKDTVWVKSPSLSISWYNPLATPNNCTRHDFTSSESTESVMAVTSSSVVIKPLWAGFVAIRPSISCNIGHSRDVKRLWCIIEDDIFDDNICLWMLENRQRAGCSRSGNPSRINPSVGEQAPGGRQ